VSNGTIVRVAPICISFAGTPGSQKSPVAVYLSYHLKLPMFENDAIRSEVQVDTMKKSLDQDEYLTRRDARLNGILKQGISFIYDASIDRAWPRLKPKLEAHGYRWFVIDMHISWEFSARIQANHGRTLPDDAKRWFSDHDKFHRRFADNIGLTIADGDFPQRNEMALEAVQKWIRTG
jgi:hypothetical protein